LIGPKTAQPAGSKATCEPTINTPIAQHNHDVDVDLDDGASAAAMPAILVVAATYPDTSNALAPDGTTTSTLDPLQ